MKGAYLVALKLWGEWGAVKQFPQRKSRPKNCQGDEVSGYAKKYRD
jgi:hypothetical protein